jgi:hypothetical protein
METLRRIFWRAKENVLDTSYNLFSNNVEHIFLSEEPSRKIILRIKNDSASLRHGQRLAIMRLTTLPNCVYFLSFVNEHMISTRKTLPLRMEMFFLVKKSVEFFDKLADVMMSFDIMGAGEKCLMLLQAKKYEEACGERGEFEGLEVRNYGAFCQEYIAFWYSKIFLLFCIEDMFPGNVFEIKTEECGIEKVFHLSDIQKGEFVFDHEKYFAKESKDSKNFYSSDLDLD